MELDVICPICDKPWKVILEEKSDDSGLDGYLVCPECTHTDSKNQNGGLKVKQNGSVDLYPGDC